LVSRVYLETSFFSECCTIRTTEIARGRRATSVKWWGHDARKFDLHISSEVVRELSSAAFPEQVRTPALKMLEGLPQLALTDEVLGVASVLVRERVMPGPASEGDALHVAVALVHQTGSPSHLESAASGQSEQTHTPSGGLCTTWLFAAGDRHARLDVLRRLTMSTQKNTTKPDESGVADVRRVREEIARQHDGNLAEHAAESNRIANALREKLRLGPVVQPPARKTPRSAIDG
jgi:hypothetical protein